MKKQSDTQPEAFFGRVRDGGMGHAPIEPLIRGDELRAASANVSRTLDHRERSFEQPGGKRRGNRKLALQILDEDVLPMEEPIAESSAERRARHRKRAQAHRRRKRGRLIRLILIGLLAIILALSLALKIIERVPELCVPPCAPAN